MKKNNYISLVLLFVFSFALMHNIIPHHHHEDVSDINNHEYNHHHHDKKEQDHHNENDEPNGLFSHLTHILASTEFIFNSDKRFQKTQYTSQFFLIDNFVIKPITVPIKKEPPNYIPVIPLQFYYSTNFHRGPPVCFV